MSYFLLPTFIEAFNLDLYINSEVWSKEQGAIRTVDYTLYYSEVKRLKEA
jgi:hypothetical protein